jgi:hypothetical protein
MFDLFETISPPRPGAQVLGRIQRHGTIRLAQRLYRPALVVAHPPRPPARRTLLRRLVAWSGLSRRLRPG